MTVRAALSRLLAVAWLLLLGAPALAGSWAPEAFTLDNGMEVIVLTDRRMPVATHMVWYRVGSADEPRGKSGIAHFLEHLMFKGTKTIPPGEFSKTVARLGGQDNAFTSYDYTAYFQRIAIDRLPRVMEMEADRMRNLVLSDAVVLPERDVILEERRSRTDNNPSALLFEQVSAALFQNHPYGIPIIGWFHEMEGLTRADALDFYARHYAPDNAILIVAGDIDAATLRPLAERYYGPLKRVGTPPRQRVAEPPARAPRRVAMTDARARQPYLIRLGLAPAYARAEGRTAHALDILAEILGGGTTSRLYRSLVVEQKLAASAGVSYEGDALDYGRFSLYGVPREGVSLSRLEAGLDGEVARLLKEGVSAAEVTTAAERLVAGVTFARDSQFNMARIYGVARTTDQSVADIIAWPERIAAVTPDDVMAAARAVLAPEGFVTGTLEPAGATK